MKQTAHVRSERIPALVPGIEVLPFDKAGSAPGFLLVHPNGRRWAVSDLLRDIICSIDGVRDVDAIAREIAERRAGEVSQQQVRELIAGFLTRNGVVEDPRERFEISPDRYLRTRAAKSNLWWRLRLASARRLQPFTNVLQHLFTKSVATPLIVGTAGLEIFWLIRNGLPLKMRVPDLSGTDWALMSMLLLVSMLIHELGHASACKKMGAEHGAFGIGLYLIFPVFFQELNDAWKLAGWRRAIIDLGGIYLQGVFGAGALLLYMVFRNAGLLATVVAINLSILANLNPLMKLDGYWFVCDLSGVANLAEQARNFWSRRGGETPLAVTSSRRIVVVAYAAVSAAFWVILSVYLWSYWPKLIAVQYPTAWANVRHAAEDLPASGNIVRLLNALAQLGRPTAMILAGLILPIRIFIFRAARRRAGENSR